MVLKLLAQATKSLRMGILIAGVVGLLLGVLAWFQVEREQRIDLEDVERRAHVLVHQLSLAAGEALKRPDPEAAQALGGRLEGYRSLLGFALYRAEGQLVAVAKEVAEFSELLKKPVARVLEKEPEIIEIMHAPEAHLHILASRLTTADGTTQGVLAVVHDISYLDERATGRLIRSSFWILVLTFLVLTLIIGVTWIAYERPLRGLADWMRRLRTENVAESPPGGLPVERLASESARLAASFRAARSATLSRSRAVVQADKVWTRERLRAHAVDCLKGGQLIVVSNREPYMHQFHEGRARVIMPAGGLVTALDPVLQACGGVWVAHGAGDADRLTSDPHGRILVPPSEPRYTLRRVWLTREEEQGYYYGFANEGLWPLCHLVHERPVFRASDFAYYLKANQRFSETVLEEVGSSPALVLVQDYHLALLPQLLKQARPDLSVGAFWHIPWPNPEAFRICPWRVEILEGMLGADLVGFHLQQYCNNFLDTVDRMVEARLDWDHFAVELKGHTSLVRPFPIGVESWAERGIPSGEKLRKRIAQLKELHKLEGAAIAVGVDRIDYTKGLLERFRAVARFFEKYPEYRGRLTFVQLGAPSRTHLRRYRDLLNELEQLADDINWRFQTDGWQPVHFLAAHHDGQAVHAFLSMASICIVSSLHDGMNLVAKEFVAAREEGDGVLILSEFAGAARELTEALIINPYDTEQFAEALRVAMEMEAAEQRLRMERLRQTVQERNVYYWAGNLLAELSAISTVQTPPPQEMDLERKPGATPVAGV